MPSQRENSSEGGKAAVRSLWSGTITFGLVSIPVDLFSAVRPRHTAMKLVDKEGHALGRRYHCSKEGKKLAAEEIVRGYETDSGEVVVITDEELQSVAPEMSRDIELRRFVPLEQIPAMYYDKAYFLAPAGRSAKAYNLLVKTMESTSRAAIGTFVMRGREYLVAIVADNGVLRAATLRHADEVRTPEKIGLPPTGEASSKKIEAFIKDIEDLTADELNMAEFEDRDAEVLQELAETKQKRGQGVIDSSKLEDEDPDAAAGGAKIIDLMAVLRKSLAKNAVVTTARDESVAESGQSQRRPSRHTSVKKKVSTQHGSKPKRSSARTKR